MQTKADIFLVVKKINKKNLFFFKEPNKISKRLYIRIQMGTKIDYLTY